MKYMLFSGWLSVWIMFPNPSRAQTDLNTVLKQTFDAFESAVTTREKTALSDRISVIAGRWSNEWITHYYVAYTKAVLSEDKETSESKRDALLDLAETEIAKAAKLPGCRQDELELLSAFVASCRIGIDPMARYNTFGKAYSSHLKQATALNPGNPRIYYLQGSVWYGMPKFAGGGPAVAMPFLLKADSLYAKERDDDIARPYWGKRANRALLERSKATGAKDAPAPAMASAAATNGMSGIWTGSLPLEGGGSYPLKYALDLTQGKLTGSTEASGSTVPIMDGRIEGDSLFFYIEGMGERMPHLARYYPEGDSIGITIQMGGRSYHATLQRAGRP